MNSQDDAANEPGRTVGERGTTGPAGSGTSPGPPGVRGSTSSAGPTSSAGLTGATDLARDATDPARDTADAGAADVGAAGASSGPHGAVGASSGASAVPPSSGATAVEARRAAGSTATGGSWRSRLTRGVARPEGGGRAAPGDAPAPARQWPILVVVGVAGVGLLVTALDGFRIGTLLVGVALLVGAALRWSIPSVGMLAVRSRFTDMVTYGVLGTVIVLLAMMVQPEPWLEIPFLDDTLHFTIS